MLAGLRSAVSPSTTKAAAKEFSLLDAASCGADPLHALRRAQVASLGGAEWMAEAACESRLADSIGSAEEEEFALSALQWAVRHEDALAEPFTARSTIDFFIEMSQVQVSRGVSGPLQLRLAVGLPASLPSA